MESAQTQTIPRLSRASCGLTKRRNDQTENIAKDIEFRTKFG